MKTPPARIRIGIKTSFKPQRLKARRGRVIAGVTESFKYAALECLPRFSSQPAAFEISLLFTTNKHIKYLNCLYRKKDKATDVLSFAQGQDTLTMPPHASVPLGDIVISIERAEIQAKDLGHPLKFELLRLLIHGYLHLLGYEHERVQAKEASKMRRLERRLFAKHSKLI